MADYWCASSICYVRASQSALNANQMKDIFIVSSLSDTIYGCNQYILSAVCARNYCTNEETYCCISLCVYVFVSSNVDEVDANNSLNIQNVGL